MVLTSMSNSGPISDDPKDKKPASAGTPRTTGSLPVPKTKRGLKGFYSEVLREMKKVTWPTRAETNRLTGVVLSVCIGLVTFLSVLGFVFGFIIDLITKGRV